MQQLWMRDGKIMVDEDGKPILSDICPCSCFTNLRGASDWCCFRADKKLTLNITNIRPNPGQPAIPCGMDEEHHFQLCYNRDLAADLVSTTTHERDVGWGTPLTWVLYSWVSGGGGTTGFPPFANNSWNVLYTFPNGIQLRATLTGGDCCGASQTGATITLLDPNADPDTGSTACPALPYSGISALADIEIIVPQGCCKGATLLTCRQTPGDCDGNCPPPADSLAPGRITGLGDVVAAGIKVATLGLLKPCQGCQERQAKLNKAVPFRRKNRRKPK